MKLLVAVLRWACLGEVCALLLLGMCGCGQPAEPVAQGAFPLQERWRFEARQHDKLTEPAVGAGMAACFGPRTSFMR